MSAKAKAAITLASPVSAVPTFPDIATLAESPHTPAALSRTDPDMPENTIVLGRDAWEHYAQIAEGCFIAGEIVAIVARDEVADDGGVVHRRLLVLRATRPIVCAAAYEDPTTPPRGELFKERVNGAEKVKDVYSILPGTLFATNLRTRMRPLVPIAHKAYACEVFIRVGRQVKLKSNAKQSSWDLSLAFRPLNHARDTSLDYLGAVETVEAVQV